MFNIFRNTFVLIILIIETADQDFAIKHSFKKHSFCRNARIFVRTLVVVFFFLVKMKEIVLYTGRQQYPARVAYHFLYKFVTLSFVSEMLCNVFNFTARSFVYSENNVGD